MRLFKSIVSIGVLSTFAMGSLFSQKPKEGYPIEQRLKTYKTIKLTTDTLKLSEAEKECIYHLIKAAEFADLIFWEQTYMPKKEALKKVKDENLKKFMEINYGPWDRLNNDAPFVKGVGEKPKGVNFYPEDFNPDVVNDHEAMRVLSPYTKINRVFQMDPANPPQPPAPPEEGQVPPPMTEMFPLQSGQFVELQGFSQAYRDNMQEITNELELAASAIENEDAEFADYLRFRCMALNSDQFIESDVKWLSLNSHLDIIIGPIENYEDKLTGQKTSFEAYVLVRDQEWGEKLKKYVALLPELQAGLPVEAAYKPSLGPEETTEVDEEGNEIQDIVEEPIDIEGFPPLIKPRKPQSQLAVFDAVYYAGDCNAGSKTIAVNLPNDENLQKFWGTRRSQLKNTMRAKFDEIVIPISKEIIHRSQRKNITFDAFFNNVMFHEVAHGLGIKNLVKDPEKTVREALGPDYSAIEECKADVLGLYMVTKLQEKGELNGDLEDFYVTFVASVYRSVRFGASSAHGRANMITFNTLESSGCLERSSKGLKVDVQKMKKAINDLAAELLTLQGDGDASGVKKMLAERGIINEALTEELKSLEKEDIPVDIIFEQGVNALGLQRFEKK